MAASCLSIFFAFAIRPCSPCSRVDQPHVLLPRRPGCILTLIVRPALIVGAGEIVQLRTPDLGELLVLFGLFALRQFEHLFDIVSLLYLLLVLPVNPFVLRLPPLLDSIHGYVFLSILHDSLITGHLYSGFSILRLTHRWVLAALARHITFVPTFGDSDVLVRTRPALCSGLPLLLLSLVASIAQVIHPLHQMAECLLLLGQRLLHSLEGVGELVVLHVLLVVFDRLARVQHPELFLEHLLRVRIALLGPIDRHEVSELGSLLPLSDLDDDVHDDVLQRVLPSCHALVDDASLRWWDLHDVVQRELLLQLEDLVLVVEHLVVELGTFLVGVLAHDGLH